VIPLLDTYLKECKSRYYRDTYALMFIVKLFTIAKLWKQPRCRTTDEWIKRTSYLYTMEFYSAIRKGETIQCEGKQMQLEAIMLSEITQVQKDKGPMFSLVI
jgi:hypothetical protein